MPVSTRGAARSVSEALARERVMVIYPLITSAAVQRLHF